MCKMAGLADHGHKQAPCSKCMVSHDELSSDKAIKNGVPSRLFPSMPSYQFFLEYPLRDGATHKARCFEWKNLKTDAERNTYFARHGVRWTEFARLAYFDPIRCTIIDPMHNFLQGMQFNHSSGYPLLTANHRYRKNPMVRSIYSAKSSSIIHNHTTTRAGYDS
jgi:hypothetical protein